MIKKIAITIGDPNGIGPEIVLKSLAELKLAPEKLVIGGNSDVLNYYSDKLQIKLPFDYEIAEIHFNKSDILPGVESAVAGEFSYQSLLYACNLANEGEIQAIVTSPVSKNAMNLAGYYFSGQTEVLEKLLAKPNQKAEMLFCAGDFRVLLLTRHIPLRDVAEKITQELLIDKISALNETFKTTFKIEKPRLALCALNPHAGENGVIGEEEQKIFLPAVAHLNNVGVDVSVPLSADALFAEVAKKLNANKKLEYDCYIACYHDQGLIPIKVLTQDSAVNTTIGLNILRTSPAHGTAYDIAGKGLASPASMIAAIRQLLNFNS